MSNQDQPQLYYQDIMKYEWKIMELLRYNTGKYKYTGEETKEYEVIQSVFYELNQLKEFSNKHIRWYAIIINLWQSFHQLRLKAKRRDDWLDFPLLEAGGKVKFFEWESLDTDHYQFTARLGKDVPPGVMVPPYIAFIELFIDEIARLGMLVCTKESPSIYYLDYKLNRIQVNLKELLKEMEVHQAGGKREEVFLLTVRHAAENVLKLTASMKNHEKKSFMELLEGELFRGLMAKHTANIEKKRFDNYYNMDAFWNGFIP